MSKENKFNLNTSFHKNLNILNNCTIHNNLNIKQNLNLDSNIFIKGSYINFDTNNDNILGDNGFGIKNDNGIIKIKHKNDIWNEVSAAIWNKSANNIYYNKGNIGLGLTSPNSNYILDIDGNINISENINCIGNSINNNIIANNLFITNTSQSNNTNDGCLKLLGGLAIKKNLNIDGNINGKDINLKGDLNIINGNLTVPQIKLKENTSFNIIGSDNDKTMIVNTNKVGIGNLEPESGLHINNNINNIIGNYGIHMGMYNNNAIIDCIKSDNNKESKIIFGETYKNSNTKYEQIISKENELKFYANTSIDISTNILNKPHLFINKKGNIGISHNNPVSELSIGPSSSVNPYSSIKQAGIYLQPHSLNNSQLISIVTETSSENISLYEHGRIEFKNTQDFGKIDGSNDKYTTKIESYNKKQNNIFKSYINIEANNINLDATSVNIAGTTHSFTGGHFVLLEEDINEYDSNVLNNDKFKEGLIISVIDTEYISINNTIMKTKLAKIEKDPTVVGILNQYIYNENLILPTNISINSIGEGAIWVTNINGNISIGDYIVSSIIPGYGQKQDDNILYNYTVAKSISNIDWENINDNIYINNNNYKKCLIGCIYYCG